MEKTSQHVKESYCREQENITAATIEQLERIKEVAEERDNLKKQLEWSQEELGRLRRSIEEKKLYAVQTPSRGDAETGGLSNLSQYPEIISTETEIKELEDNIEQMRNQNITPEIRLKIIQKEVEVMKKYCSKLSLIQNENEELKEQVFFYEDSLAKIGCFPITPALMEDLKLKFEAINENDKLKEKIHDLEKELCIHTYSPHDVEMFRQRSLLLEEVLKDRDRLSQKVEQLRSLDQEVHSLKKKAARVDELECCVMKLNRSKSFMEEEIIQLTRKLSDAEEGDFHKKAEVDILRSKVVCMEHEIESLKSMCEDKERLKSERDHLRNNLEEMIRELGDVDYMKKQIQCMEMFKAERDIFKSKYENLMGLECECDILKAQLDRAKDIERERNYLEFRVEDLEACIADQENEIKRLVCHIDLLAKGRDEEQEKFREHAVQMRAEIEEKDSLISATQEKLSSLEVRLTNSIHGLNSQTLKHKNKTSKLKSVICTLNLEVDSLKARNEELENYLSNIQAEYQKLVHHIVALKIENDNITKHLKDLTEDNVFLIQTLEEKEDTLNTLSEVLKDHEPILDEFEKSQSLRIEFPRDKKTENDSICLITSELEMTKEENRRLHDKVHKISNLAADQQLHELLLHSKSAIKRISLELNKQCDGWHNLQNQIQVFRSDDGNVQHITKPEKLIVNYTLSTGINTDMGTWDCTKTKKIAKSTEISEITNANIPVTRNDVEVECSSLIIQDVSKLDAGTITKKTEIVSVGVDTPSTLKLEDSQNVERRICKKKLVHSITQKPEKVIYASKPRAKSEAIQLEYNMSRWNFLKESLTPHTIISRSVTSLDSNKRIIYSQITSVTKAQDNVLIVPMEPYQRSNNQKRPKLVTVATKTNKIMSKDEEVETFETARSFFCSRCKSLEERIQILEKELIASNNIMLRLKDEVCKGVKIAAENEALRKHSTEVQEVAIDRIEDLIEHVKKFQEKTNTLEDENKKLNTCNCNLQLKIKQLSQMIQEAQNENEQLSSRNAAIEKELKDDSELCKLRSELLKAVSDKNDLEKLILEDTEKNKKRTNSLEKELESLVEQNKYLKEEIVRLEATINESEMLNSKLANSEGRIAELKNNLRHAIEENKQLIKELNTIKFQLKQYPTIDVDELNDLRKENENLLKKIKAQALERNELLDKLKTPHVDVPSLPPDMKDEGVLVTICQDLEGQLKCLEKASLPNEMADEFQRMVKDLCKRLENSEYRAKEAETLLRSMKVSDRTAMLSDELNKCRAKLAELESSLIEANENSDHFKAELASCKGDYEKSLKDKESLQQLIGKLETDNVKLTAALAEISEGGDLKEEIKKMKEHIAQLETENNGLRNKAAEYDRSFDKIDLLQQSIKISKQDLMKAENEVDRLKKELESSLNIRIADGNKVDELETEKKKNLTTIQNLEYEIIALKKELESVLITAKNSSTGISDLQSEIAKLKLIIDQLEGDKVKLKKDFDNVNLIKYNANTADEVSKLKAELERAKIAAQISAAAEKELENKVSNLESENARLQLISKTEDRISELENLVLTLRQQISTLEVEKSKLQKDLDKSKSICVKDEALVEPADQLTKLELENDRLNKELNAALDNLNYINAQILENQKESKILKQNFALLESENTRMKKQLDDISEESQTSSSELIKLKSGESTLKQRLALLESENLKVKKDLDLISNDNKNYLSQIQSLKQNNIKQEKENEKLKQSLETVTNIKEDASIWKQKAVENEEALNKLENQLKTILDEHIKCPIEISGLKEENDRLRTKLIDLENENNKLKNQYEGAMGDSLKKVSALEKLRSAESKLKELVSKLEIDNRNLQNQVTVQRTELGTIDSQLNRSKEDVANLKQKYTSLECMNIKLEKDLDEILSEKCKLQKLLNELQNDNSKLSGLIVELQNENTKLKKELDNIAATQHQHSTDELKIKHSKEIKTLQENLAKLTNERDKIKRLLNEEKKRISSVKDKNEQVKDVVIKKRKMCDRQTETCNLLGQALDDHSKTIEKFRKKSQDLKEENDNLIMKITETGKEKNLLEKSYSTLKERFERGIKNNEEIKKEVEVLRKQLADKKQKFTVKTINTVSIPDVVAITPLSEKELRFFGKKASIFKPNLQIIINKMATGGVQSLFLEELQFLYNKLCDVTAEQLAKMGQSAGVLKSNESGDKLGLLRRIAALEEELLEKQKVADHKVNAMQYAVKIGKKRLSDLQKTLEQERKLSTELTMQVDSHSKMVMDLKQEKDSIDRQKTYHERKLEEYIVTIEKERAKARNLEDELEKEKTNVLHFKSLLEAERDRARIHKRKDTEALERMRIQLEKTVNNEQLLKMKLQDKTKQRSDSPCKPVKDTNNSVTEKSRANMRAASSKDFKSISGRLSSAYNQ
ncbi:centromere-associated protein E-like [Diorhabda sublineata]|uniref:centromere-associated protein E-like n=1 Tax=Diorhabda sublineata TaxID=1163346 RepID=UPI0024E0FE1C|nr:centromere-associated protein E-like [Diorhabda sublineata]